jgi:hypothetical protein
MQCHFLSDVRVTLHKQKHLWLDVSSFAAGAIDGVEDADAARGRVDNKDVERLQRLGECVGWTS